MVLITRPFRGTAWPFIAYQAVATTGRADKQKLVHQNEQLVQDVFRRSGNTITNPLQMPAHLLALKKLCVRQGIG